MPNASWPFSRQSQMYAASSEVRVPKCMSSVMLMGTSANFLTVKLDPSLLISRP